MNVYLKENGEDLLPGDMVVRSVLRADLAPVPRTIELSVKLKDGIEDRLKEGAFFWTGWENLKYRVVKVERAKGAGMIQGKDEMGVLNITALLASCAQVSFRRSKAVVRENFSLGALFRECGADVAIAADFPVKRFTCLVGQVPSFYLAQAMQEEGACLVLRQGRLLIARISDLMKQDAVDIIGQTDTSDLIESEFIERHDIPAFFSTNDAGAFVSGDTSKVRDLRFHPRADERVLRSMSKVLVTRRIVDAQLSQTINAGDIIDIDGTKLLVITAAHVAETDDGGITRTNSRFWVGSPNA